MTRFKIWNSCKLLAVLSVLLVLHPETVQTSINATRPTEHDGGVIVALKCIFSGAPTSPCAEARDYILPNRVMQMFENMTEGMKDSIRNCRLETVTPEDIVKLPVSLFLLIPSHRLSSVPGSSLAALLTKSEDVAVAVKIMENFNVATFEEFFMMLQGVGLTSQIQNTIAKILVKLLPDVSSNWTYPRFKIIDRVGNPLLAHLPSYFLANLTKLEASKFLFHLRNWLWSNLPIYIWRGKTEASKRAWTDLMLRSSYPYNLSEWNHNEVRRFRFLLEGATPDELKQLTMQQLQNTLLFKTKLSRLQVQALFSILYSNRTLSSANLLDTQLLSVAFQLSPANLLRFNVSSTDFRILTPLFEQRKSSCSFITAKQILELLIAQSVLSGRLESVKPETWGNGIEHLGKFIYVLPANTLESYVLSPPTALVQSSIDSDRITAKQAHILTGGNVLNLEKPDLIMGQKGLLRALSTSQLASARTLPQNILYHLLVNLPPHMPLQAAALLQKLEKLIGDSWTLEKILSNKDPNQFFEMLSSRTVAAIVTSIGNIQGFDEAIKGLPQNTLSVILTATRKKLTNERGMWTSDILLSGGPNVALLGLTCNDIYAMEVVDFVYIMEQYNKVRKALNKPFPKDLQYCSQMALMNYLEMKAGLWDFKHSQLLDYLEPAEIEAIGGYILATLPTQDVEKAINGQHILEAIGQLSLPELLVATKEIKPYNYAQLLLKKHIKPCQNMTEIKVFELSSLGNLIHFLPAIDIVKINPISFKLFIESIGDSTSKVVCGADSSARSAWYQIILKTFGQPYNWTSSIIASLGDFLLVVPSDELKSVNVDSWRDAADTLTEQTSYHMKMEWPGIVDQIQFYQACAEVLEDFESSNYVDAVRGLARWYLAAVQNQLNTVVSASQLLALAYQSKKGKAERKMVIPNFPMEVQHPDKIVKVLEPNEVEQPVSMKKPGADLEFGTDQYDTSTVQATTSDILADFHTTFKPQIHATILESSSTTLSKETEAVYNAISEESRKFPGTTSAKNSSETVLPNEPKSTTLQTSTVAWHQNDETLNVHVIKILEEVSTTTTADTEVGTHRPMQASTPATENSSSPSRKFHEVNKVTHSSYLITLKGLAETSTLSLKDSSEKATVTRPTTAVAVLNGITAVPVYVNSTEKNAELSTVLPIKFSSDIENRNLGQEINLEKSISRQVKDADVSMKMGDEISIFPKRSRSGYTKVKRHVTVVDQKDQKVSQTINGNDKVEKSGEILRDVVRTNALASQTKSAGGPTHSPVTEGTSVQITERGHMTRYWQKVSCDAIRAAGLSAGLALDETDIELMGHEELEMCVDFLGSLELDNKVQRKIWSLVNKDKLLENLSDLGKLVKVLDADDVSKINLNLSSPNALDNLATLSEMVMDTHVLQEVGIHFLKSNPNTKKLTMETTVAIGRILCDVLAVSSQKLYDLLEQSVFLRTSPILGRMKDCPTHCLHKFAYLATKTSEYGPLDTWTAEDVTTLGVIPAGLRAEQWRQLSATGYGNNPLVGLKPSAIRCIPPEIFKEFDDDQLKSLPTLSAAVVSKEQLSYLSESQKLSLARVQKEVPILKHLKDPDCSTKENGRVRGSASFKNFSFLVVISLAVISRFSA